MPSKSNFFIDIEKIRTLDTFRIIYFVMFLASFGLTELGRFVYRPYVYENGIQDYGLADAMGNLGGILVQLFFGLFLLNPGKVKGLRIIAFFVIGYILYEIAQPYLPKGVFDWKDIYGTLIGGLIGAVCFLLIQQMARWNKVIYRF